MSIQSELTALKARSTLLRAEAVVEWARKHPASALHKALEWDNAKAAEEFRIWQVRRLIAIFVVSAEGDRTLISLSIDRTAGGGYRSFDDIALDVRFSEVALQDALQELERVRKKYHRLKQLIRVWAEIDKVKARAAPHKKAS